MNAIGKWIKSAVRHVVDPDRDERIHDLAAKLQHKLNSQREKFSIRKFAQQVECTSQDLELAKRKVYREVISRAWQDDKVTPGEHQIISLVVNSLAIPSDEALAIQHEVARNRFAIALSQAMDDGVLDDDETKFLEQIANSIHFTLGNFVRAYFRTEGEEFLRGIFTACTQGGVLADKAWAQLVATTQRLGLSKEDLNAAILPQAERFIEHVLVDAKSDGILSENEEAVLVNLIGRLELPRDSRQYVERTMAALKTIRLAGQGKLPSIRPPAGVSIRSGEIVHF